MLFLKKKMANNIEEYKEYYKLRAERYAGNDNWAQTYQAEKKLADFITGLESFDGAKSEVEKLTFESAKSLQKDRFAMDAKFYEKYKIIIREKYAKLIISKIDSYSNINDINTMIQEELNKMAVEESMDNANRCFQSSINLLFNYLVYSRAEVPSECKSDMNKYAEECKNSIIDVVKREENRLQYAESNFKIKPEVNLEERHFNYISFFGKEKVSELINLFKQLSNR